MTNINVQALTQRIVVDPATQAISVINAGPQGPRGFPGEDLTEELDAHINDATPHPAYDDLPSFTLIFENGLI